MKTFLISFFRFMDPVIFAYVACGSMAFIPILFGSLTGVLSKQKYDEIELLNWDDAKRFPIYGSVKNSNSSIVSSWPCFLCILFWNLLIKNYWICYWRFTLPYLASSLCTKLLKVFFHSTQTWMHRINWPFQSNQLVNDN